MRARPCRVSRRMPPTTTATSALTSAKLQASYDAGIKNITFGPTAPTATTGDCIQSTVGAYTFFKNGPGADIVTGSCT